MPFEQFRIAYDELGERMDRLEKIVKKLTPFISSEKRPEVKPKARRKRKRAK
jgi:hypothetical protein